MLLGLFSSASDRVEGLECGSRFNVIAEYLSEGAYRFSTAFGRGAFEGFWGATEENARILAERRRWLREDDWKYLAVTAGAEALLEEAAEIGIAAGTLRAEGLAAAGLYLGRARASVLPRDLVRWLGVHWEPDFLVLKRESGMTRLVAGSVCFPSSWSLAEKIGQPIEQIHGVVPGLNETIGAQIAMFLEWIKPGVSWTRSNWGLSRSAEWNQHPSRQTPRLDESVGLEEVFFRVEEQSLVALPGSGGVLFGIRLKVFPLAGLEGTEEGLRLAGLLETMPEGMAEYKGLGRARGRVVGLLRKGNY